jgi:hypothetical protein
MFFYPFHTLFKHNGAFAVARESMQAPLDQSGSNLPENRYTRKDLNKARTKAKVVGWLQGAAVGVGGYFLLGVAGWIPIALGVGAASYVGYRIFTRRSRAKKIEAGKGADQL